MGQSRRSVRETVVRSMDEFKQPAIRRAIFGQAKRASFTHCSCHGVRIYVPFNISALSIPLLRLVVLPTIPTVLPTSSGHVSTFLPAIMTNFHDPKVVLADASALLSTLAWTLAAFADWRIGDALQWVSSSFCMSWGVSTCKSVLTAILSCLGCRLR